MCKQRVLILEVQYFAKAMNICEVVEDIVTHESFDKIHSPNFISVDLSSFQGVSAILLKLRLSDRALVDYFLFLGNVVISSLDKIIRSLDNANRQLELVKICFPVGTSRRSRLCPCDP